MRYCILIFNPISNVFFGPSSVNALFHSSHSSPFRGLEFLKKIRGQCFFFFKRYSWLATASDVCKLNGTPPLMDSQPSITRNPEVAFAEGKTGFCALRGRVNSSSTMQSISKNRGIYPKMKLQLGCFLSFSPLDIVQT